MAKMTEREFLTAILAVEGIATDLADYATEGLAKLDARNDKRKNTKSKAQIENEGIMATILEALATAPMVASRWHLHAEGFRTLQVACREWQGDCCRHQGEEQGYCQAVHPCSHRG